MPYETRPASWGTTIDGGFRGITDSGSVHCIHIASVTNAGQQAKRYVAKFILICTGAGSVGVEEWDENPSIHK